MNTKFFFLLLLALLVTTSTSSLVGTRSKEVNATEQIAMIEKPAAPGQPLDIPLPPPATDHSKVHHENKSPLQPEDGKHHHFHFHRLEHVTRRQLKCLLCKIVLVLGHICCFLYCVMHAFH